MGEIDVYKRQETNQLQSGKVILDLDKHILVDVYKRQMNHCTNANRSTSTTSLNASRLIYQTRKLIKEYFHVPQEGCVVLKDVYKRQGIKSATTGRLLSIWQVIRTIASAFSLRIGGHPQFIRPLINPMAQACAIAKYGEIDEKTEDEIKGMAAGTENYGNFFAQNCFMGSSGTLLIVSTLNEIFKSNNIAQEVTANQIALNSIPIAVISVIVGIGYALWLSLIHI